MGEVPCQFWQLCAFSLKPLVKNKRPWGKCWNRLLRKGWAWEEAAGGVCYGIEPSGLESLQVLAAVFPFCLGAAAPSCPSSTRKPHVPCLHFFFNSTFFSVRGCQHLGIIKSSLMSQMNANSSGASGQKLFAVSLGFDLLFWPWQRQGELQSIKSTAPLWRIVGEGPSSS